MGPVAEAVALLVIVGIVLVFYLAARRPRGMFRPWPAISLLVLVRNQETVIEGFIRELLRLVASSRCLAVDVTVVDSGSSDATPQILERMGRRLPIKVVAWGEGPYPGCCFLAAGYLACDHPVALVLSLNEDSRVPDLLAAVEVLRRGAVGFRRRPEGRVAAQAPVHDKDRQTA